jgi:hypothetical protein
MASKKPSDSAHETEAEAQFRAEYRARLIDGGLSPAQAAQTAARTALPASSTETFSEQAELQTLTKRPAAAQVDYRDGKMPAWVREVIETHLAIETEDAKSAGALGYMARALVTATMPYKDPKSPAFTRVNGDFRLRIVAGYEGGVPFGIYPRLLMSWVATEAVRSQSPVIELGESLSMFLRDVLDIQRGGGKRGSSTRVAEQMKRLFGSLITAQYTGNLKERGFALSNVLIADRLELHEEDLQLDYPEDEEPAQEGTDPAGKTRLWTPQDKELAGTWKSKVKLSEQFFRECVDKPVPIDLRAYKALRGSPLAMDVYTWLTYRMSYTQRRTRPIPWEALMNQFGSSFESPRAVLDFKRGFLKALKAVQIVYPRAELEITETGVILLPSPTHVAKQPELF